MPPQFPGRIIDGKLPIWAFFSIPPAFSRLYTLCLRSSLIYGYLLPPSPHLWISISPSPKAKGKEGEENLSFFLLIGETATFGGEGNIFPDIYLSVSGRAEKVGRSVRGVVTFFLSSSFSSCSLRQNRAGIAKTPSFFPFIPSAPKQLNLAETLPFHSPSLSPLCISRKERATVGGGKPPFPSFPLRPTVEARPPPPMDCFWLSPGFGNVPMASLPSDRSTDRPEK